MAKFPIQTAGDLTVPAVSGNVQSSVDVRTGSAQVARAVGAISDTVFDAASKMFLKQAHTETAENEAYVQDEVNNLYMDFEREQDETKYPQMWNKLFAKLRSRKVKNGRAAEQYSEALLRLKPDVDMQVFAKQTDRADEKLKFVISKQQAQAVATGNDRVLRARLGQMQQDGVISEEEADFRLAQVQPGVAKTQLRNNQAAFEDAIEKEFATNGGDLQAALSKFEATGAENEFGLTRGQAQTIINSFEGAILKRSAKAKADLEEQKKVDFKEWWNKHRQGLLVTGDDLSKTSLEVETQMRLNNLDIARAEQIIEDNLPTTSLTEGVRIRRLISDVTSGDVDLDEALKQYETIALDIDEKDTEQFLDDIFNASEQRSDKVQRDLLTQNTTLLKERQSLLRSTISRVVPGSILAADPELEKKLGINFADEMAARAEIELSDLWRDRSKITQKELDRSTDKLIRKYQMSPTALQLAVVNRDNLLKASEEKQARHQQFLIDSLIKAGREVEADEVRRRARSLGLPIGGVTDPTVVK